MRRHSVDVDGETSLGDVGNPRAWHVDVDGDAPQDELEILLDKIYERCIDLPTATMDCFNRFSLRTYKFSGEDLLRPQRKALPLLGGAGQ
jgi:hypothetical protein